MAFERLILTLAVVFLVGEVACWDYGKLTPIYENEEWLVKHPALAGFFSQFEVDLNMSKSAIQGRITGGTSASNNQFPYQVGLVIELESGDSICGGSLISNNFVLTVAHCVDMDIMVTVLIGAHEIFEDYEENRIEQEIPPTRIKIHDSYNSSGYQNDIALVRLNRPVQLSDYVEIIKLPRYSQSCDTFAAYNGIVSGWGRVSDSNLSNSEILRYVNVTVMTNAACESYYGSVIEGKRICTSGEKRVGPCGGDSGGPLVVTDDSGTQVQVGLVSFGFGFGCTLNWPTVYTRTSRYLTWISRNSDVFLRF